MLELYERDTRGLRSFGWAHDDDVVRGGAEPADLGSVVRVNHHAPKDPSPGGMTLTLSHPDPLPKSPSRTRVVGGNKTIHDTLWVLAARIRPCSGNAK